MLAKINRFHGRKSLNSVYKKGQTVNRDQISLRYASNRSKGVLVAVVISKKTHKSSVVRNRIRRRVYEYVRKNLNNITPNTSLIISIYSDRFKSTKAREIEDILGELLNRANVLSIKSKNHDKLDRKEGA